MYRWSEPAHVWEKVPAPFSRRGGTQGGSCSACRRVTSGGLNGSAAPSPTGTAPPGTSSRRRTAAGRPRRGPTGELITGGQNGRLGRLPATPARVQDRVMETTGRGWDLMADFSTIWASPDGTAVHAAPGPFWLTPNGWERAPTTGTVSTGLSGSGAAARTTSGASAARSGRALRWSDVVDGHRQPAQHGDVHPVRHQRHRARGRVGGGPQRDDRSLRRQQLDVRSRRQPQRSYAVHAASPDDVWAVGKNGARQHYTIAGGWKLEPPYISLELRGVFSAGRTTSGWPAIRGSCCTGTAAPGQIRGSPT